MWSKAFCLMPESNPNDQKISFVSHLVELRTRLIHALVAMLAIFLLLAPFANDIYSLIAQPLLMHIPEGTSMVAIEVISPFLSPLKLTLMLSVFVSIPWIFYQVWLFVSPSLYKHEQRIAAPLITATTLLFYSDILFANFTEE